MSDDATVTPDVVTIGASFSQLVLHIEREKYRVMRDSGEHAPFLLVGKTRYQRMVGEFYASNLRSLLAVSVDNLESLIEILGLTIVIDPTHEHRLEVIGPVRWEAFR